MTGMGCCTIELPWYLLNSSSNQLIESSLASFNTINKTGDETDETEEDDDQEEDIYYEGDEENDNEIDDTANQDNNKYSIRKVLDPNHFTTKASLPSPTSTTTTTNII